MTAPSTGHQEVFVKLTVRAQTLLQSELRNRRTLRASDLKIVYGDRFSLKTQLIKPDNVMISPTVSLGTYPLCFFTCCCHCAVVNITVHYILSVLEAGDIIRPE